MPLKKVHPGTELKNILSKENITQRDFAAKIDITVSLLNSIIKGTRNLTVNIAISLEAAGYKTAVEWMKMQIEYQIEKSKQDEKFVKKTDDITTWKKVKQIIPFKFFKKMGIITNDISSDLKKIYNIYTVDNPESLEKVINDYKLNHFRKSSAFKESRNNVIGWSMLAENRALEIKVNPFNKSSEQVLINELRECFYKNLNTIKRTENILAKHGIKFFTLEKAEQTPVDGKSFMSENNPTIVLTLKYKRLDNFAFTLMHEIGHVFLHFTKAKYVNESFFINSTTIEKEEIEANQYAADCLLKNEIWQEFANQQKFDDISILAFAKRIKVHPGIIRGRICHFYPEYYTKRSKIHEINILK